MNKFQLTIVIFCLYNIFNTKIQNGAFPSAIQNAIWSICAIFIIEYAARILDIKEFLKYSSYGLDCLVFINFLSILLFPTGLLSIIKRNYLIVEIFVLGQQNQYTLILILTSVLILYRILIFKEINMFFDLLGIISILLTLYAKSSATAKISFIILFVCVFAYLLFPKVISIFSSPGKSVIISSIIFLLITRLLSMNSVKILIVNILHKDVTLSERTTIWKAVYDVLKNLTVFLFGKGEVPEGEYITIYTGNSFSAHNLILQILLCGGICLLLIFLYAIWILILKYKVIPNKRYLTIVSILLFVFFVSNMTEVYEMPIIWITLYYFYLISRITIIQK